MKKLFALLAVVSLAAIGCDDKKTTGKTTPTGTNTTLVHTVMGKEEKTVHATATVIEKKETVVDTKTVQATRTVSDSKGPKKDEPK